MPIPLIGQIFYDGLDSVPHISTILKAFPWLVLLWALKIFFNGSFNDDARIMHGKVVMVTGGTSGIGRAVVEDLASRGAQLILLVKDTSDVFTVEYIQDLRERHSNELIYAEPCDLSDLHSVRQFATKFIDNAPPRRLDLVVCCAGVMAPPFAPRAVTEDGVEVHLGVNYLGHFHLLNILSAVMRAQPPDRDVRVLLATCGSHLLGDLDLSDLQFLRRGYPAAKPWACYGASKTALMVFGGELQRRLDAYQRKDGEKVNVRVFNVDPGLARTPGARRWLSLGSLWGLALYLITWPLWWLVLKSPNAAAQTFLAAAMSQEYTKGEGGRFLKECKVQSYRKPEITDTEVGKQLWEVTEKLIATVEKESAKRRAVEKKSRPETAETRAEEAQEKERREKLRKKAEEAEIRKKLLDKLIKEDDEKRMSSMDMPSRVLRLPTTPQKKSSGGAPDTPARNTRSKSKTPQTPAPEVGSLEEGSEKSAARRRTKKA